MFYIRFTDDIERDIERGHSFHFRNGSKLNGLCAWEVMDYELSPFASDDEIIAAARKTAEMISKNGYGGYSSESEYAVLSGSYSGSSNDGVLINVGRIISIESI